jgi:pimeloyl-ACP methyl ester carboxylesterase
MQTLDVRGTPVDVTTTGSGPPLLYLHAEQFVGSTGPFLEALAKGHRVIAPRHPGYGSEQSIGGDIRSVGDLAYLYLDLIDQLGLDKPTLVGASLGGWIALEMAVRNPQRIGRMALIGSVGVKFSDREARDFADIFYLGDNQAFPTLFADPAKWAPRDGEMPMPEVEALARERQSLAYYAWKPYLHNPGLKRWLHRADVPTLVLWGEQDRFAEPAYARRLAASLPQANLELISGAGHYPQIEQAAATARAITAFAGR